MDTMIVQVKRVCALFCIVLIFQQFGQVKWKEQADIIKAKIIQIARKEHNSLMN